MYMALAVLAFVSFSSWFVWRMLSEIYKERKEAKILVGLDTAIGFASLVGLVVILIIYLFNS